MTDQQRNQIEAFRQRGDSYKNIADVLGVSVNTVKSFCRNNGLSRKKTSASDDVCPICGKAIVQTAKRKRRKFCSKECRVVWWNSNRNIRQRQGTVVVQCAYCGKEFSAYPNERRKYCSHSCYVTDRFQGGNRHVK